MNQFCIRGTAQKMGQGSGLVGMLEYYQRDGIRLDDLEVSAGKGFDPVALKYDLLQITEGILNGAAKLPPNDDKQRRAYWKQYHIKLEEIDKLETDKLRTFIYERIYDYLQDYEDSHELVSLTKKDITHVMENLYMIYNTEDEEIRQVVQLINLISQNVISKYIQIDGLERLFNEQYIDFEWEMHLGMDHK